MSCPGCHAFAARMPGLFDPETLAAKACRIVDGIMLSRQEPSGSGPYCSAAKAWHPRCGRFALDVWEDGIMTTWKNSEFWNLRRDQKREMIESKCSRRRTAGPQRSLTNCLRTSRPSIRTSSILSTCKYGQSFYGPRFLPLSSRRFEHARGLKNCGVTKRRNTTHFSHG
jgi:hypothetical protein